MNRATIELEDPDETDFEWLYQIITDFVNETESDIGQRILDDWDLEKQQFIKVHILKWKLNVKRIIGISKRLQKSASPTCTR